MDSWILRLTCPSETWVPFILDSVIQKTKPTVKNRKLRKGHLRIWSERSR